MEDNVNHKTRHPDTGEFETKFRERVRLELNLPWDTRDATLFTELARLRKLDDDVKRISTLVENAS